jgi:hypothetical protein
LDALDGLGDLSRRAEETARIWRPGDMLGTLLQFLDLDLPAEGRQGVPELLPRASTAFARQ